MNQNRYDEKLAKSLANSYQYHERCAQTLKETIKLLNLEQPSATEIKHSSKTKFSEQANGLTRVEQLFRFLKQNGPARQSEIVKATNIPSGTVPYVLKKSEYFKKGKDKRWAVRDGVESVG